MNLFDPRTFSTDWEVFIIDKLERCVDGDKLKAFAGYLTQACDLPVQTDWDALEFAMGINRSFAQLWGRLQQVTDRAAQLAGEFDLDLFPAAAQPTDWLLNASHIHVGTVHDEAAGAEVQTRLLKYTPVFAALASNSPVSNHHRTEFKSYRVRRRANWCSRPDTVRDPEYFQYHWGTDACQQLHDKPTLEVRVSDCASSRRFLAEFATFVAASVHHLGTRAETYRPSPREYRDCMTNRWAASRYGLQATFLWDGATRPVAEIADEMLDACREELAALGVTRAHLGILNMMLAKRTCQADWVLTIRKRYDDPYLFASAYAKLLRHWEIFEEWLESAPALEPAPAPDEESILAEHRDVIGEGTYFYRTRELMAYPPPVADALLERLIERGEIRREVTTNRGTVLHRLR